MLKILQDKNVFGEILEVILLVQEMGFELSDLISFLESIVLLALGVDVLEGVRNDGNQEIEHDNVHKKEIYEEEKVQKPVQLIILNLPLQIELSHQPKECHQSSL